MKLILQREIFSAFQSEFKDEKKGVVITKKIQVMEKLENGKFVLSEIKLDDKQDITQLTQGTKIQMSVSYSSMVQGKNRVVYFRQDGELKIITK
ncbi:hypothetical protein ACN4FE_04550 [Aliarcobacter butzleri]|jgi:hypothetical protein|uniref:hypothetical protein n=1 Tax=Aliarcobacter butzleri TaxID=28197 RepID=UPI003AF875DD